MLARYGFGRAHHRVIYFVGRHPQMSVSDLLGILRITKQSLSRVLGQLVRQGFIVQQRRAARPPPAPARAHAEGRRARAPLSENQRQRIANAPIAKPAPRRSRASARSCSASRAIRPRRFRRGRCGSRADRAIAHGACRLFPVYSAEGDPAAHLLVVDDDARLRELLRRFLTDQGFRVTTAVDAAEARAQARELRFRSADRRCDDAGRGRLRPDPEPAPDQSRIPILLLTAMAEPETASPGSSAAPTITW